MSIPFVLTTSPLIPCLRRVPFDATKRNQKSPLGAGPSICIARIASRVAHDPLPCLRMQDIGVRYETEPRALLRESSRKAFRAYLHWFFVCEELSPKTGWRYGLAMSIPFVPTTSPHIPCLRRVPFDATKRNQKSPLGAGPSICIARIASRGAPELLPCQPRRKFGPRRWTEQRALL